MYSVHTLCKYSVVTLSTMRYSVRMLSKLLTLYQVPHIHMLLIYSVLTFAIVLRAHLYKYSVLTANTIDIVRCIIFDLYGGFWQPSDDVSIVVLHRHLLLFLLKQWKAPIRLLFRSPSPCTTVCDALACTPTPLSHVLQPHFPCSNPIPS